MAHQFLQATPVPASQEYYDLGSFGRKISTTSPDAQIWFNRGLTWAYAFNHQEAEKCFQQVLAHDPTCVMGYWGVAFATGPNYNKQWAAFDEADLRRTVQKTYHVPRAGLAHLSTATPLEQSLVQAIQHRFPTDGVIEDFDATNRAYADAMRAVYHEHRGEDDLDLTALFADALMNVSPWGLYEASTGQPILSTPVLEVKEVLERGLKDPMAKSHPGILHMYIHLMEMSTTPEAALVPADHLRDLIPESGHLCHMPSHLDVLVGDYRRSIASNTKATIADDKFYAREGGQNFYSFYRLHNYHSLIYAAMLAGQSAVSLDATDRMESTIPEALLRIESPPMANWMEYFLSVRVHVLIRFGLWENLKALSLPTDADLYCVTIATIYYGKAIAYAATNNIPEAERHRTLYHSAASRVPDTRINFPNKVNDELRIATAMLDGELEYRRGKYDVAFAHLREAIRAEDALLYSEPWGWMLPARHPYAALLLEQGHVAEAAEVYAEDLGLSQKLAGTHRHPNNVWALHGYHECLVRLGRDAEARMVEPTLKVALAVADVNIQASCFCRLEKMDGCGC
ncbi:tetratricopeptide repeat protein [Aspergillus affinis]|uniref:tetratricopeptide repeat protein n=1 Tax=Aspergillus affinis TaxID=1070780 RepID=UPI0022FDF7EE|nr:uncharacterized protein KD926_006667 [Aspergillus affinis]KAI9041593.1 hypothetical protein KD926_006667 [Aspergillus affinis]